MRTVGSDSPSQDNGVLVPVKLKHFQPDSQGLALFYLVPVPVVALAAAAVDVAATDCIAERPSQAVRSTDPGLLAVPLRGVLITVYRDCTL